MHCQIAELPAVRELAQYDQEDDQTGDPRPELVSMYNFIPEHGDDPCRRRDDDDARIARNVGVDGVDQLGADYDVHGGPAHTGEDIEACNYEAALVLVASAERETRDMGVRKMLHS